MYVSLYVYIKKVNYEKKYFDNAISSRIRISILGQMSKDKNLLHCLLFTMQCSPKYTFYHHYLLAQCIPKLKIDVTNEEEPILSEEQLLYYLVSDGYEVIC